MDSRKLLFQMILWSSLLVATPSFAGFISKDSVYGQDSITLDTLTGLEWIDPWLPIVQGGSAGHFNSYYDVKALLGVNGYYEGFRYATRSELENLLYVSAGIDPITSKSTSTSTEADVLAIGNLLDFVDTTWPNILDAIFEDGGVVTGSVLFHYDYGLGMMGGKVSFYTSPNLTHNSNPYGHWLVRETNVAAGGYPNVAVSEPPMLIFLGALLFVFGRKKEIFKKFSA